MLKVLDCTVWPIIRACLNNASANTFAGRYVAVLFNDPSNPQDAVVIAAWT